MKSAGIALLVIGILLTIFTSFKYFTKEKVVDLGSVEITKEAPHTVSLSPWVGIGAIAIGGLLLMQSGRKAS